MRQKKMPKGEREEEEFDKYKAYKRKAGLNRERQRKADGSKVGNEEKKERDPLKKFSKPGQETSRQDTRNRK